MTDRICAICALALSAAGLGEARAQEAAPAPSGLEEIVVTATRREERLQDIPVTVSAITANSVKAAGIVEVRNLTQLVPGFTGSRNVGVSLPSIRGVGSSGNSPGDESNVATYIDGVYQPDPFSTLVDLVEIERVEVLRGPQGAVFGRNATGGLINIITPDPGFETRGHLSARYGRMRENANDYDLRAYVTGGLTEKVAVDVAAMFRKNDGYVKDLVRGGHLGDNQVVNGRAKLLIEPDDRSRIVLTAEIADQNSTMNAVQPLDGNTAGRKYAGAILPAGPWEAALDQKPKINFRRYNVSARARIEFDGFNLESTTGYLKSDVSQSTDSDASNFLLQNVSLSVRTESISEELRLLSTGDGAFKWTAGVYGFHLSANSPDITISVASAPGAPVGVTVLSPEVKTDSLAAFAEGTYELAQSLFLTAGGRFTTEKRKFRQSVNGVPINAAFTDTSFDKATYRAAIRYEFAPKANVYASYGTGFKSGVFNAVGTSLVPTKPETIDAAEAGIKADPFSWLRTNLSIYRYDYKNLQVLVRDPDKLVFLLQNAANARIYGGELEVTATPVSRLNLRGSVAYTHGEYKEFRGAQVALPQPEGGNRIVAADVSGNRMIRTPRYSFNVGFDWGVDAAGGLLTIAGNVYHSDRVYYDPMNLFSQPAYTMVRSDISWATPDEKWVFSLWATNLTNAKVAQQIRVNTFDTDIVYEPPRRVGVGAQYRF
jgi:iron complex outermembrane receptor protein